MVPALGLNEEPGANPARRVVFLRASGGTAILVWRGDLSLHALPLSLSGNGKGNCEVMTVVSQEPPTSVDGQRWSFRPHVAHRAVRSWVSSSSSGRKPRNMEKSELVVDKGNLNSDT